MPITFSGKSVFFEPNSTKPDARLPELGQKVEKEIEKQVNPFPDVNQPVFNRDPAGQNLSQDATEIPEEIRNSIFGQLETLENALVTDNHIMIQDLLPKFDLAVDRLIEVRTAIGSTINKVDLSIETIEKNKINNEEYRSRIEDADVAELFTDLTRQENVLNASYKASAQLLNNNLMKYLR